jgi:hypothetical protein
MALLDQCSWAYSDPSNVVEGQTFSFAAAVPPMVQTGGLVGTVLDTATAATIVWRVTDAALNPLVPGDDYQIVSGGLDQMSLAFVVNPSLPLRTPPIPQFKVQPILTVAGGGAQVISNVPPPLPNSPWLPVTYALTPPTNLGGKAANLLKAALQLTSSADLVEPGDSVTLKVVQNAMTSAPQVVTNLVHELPEVKIRGAIPLGALVEAIIGPLAGAVSAALPSSTDSVTGEVGDVANLLAEALAIPIAIDVGGRKVTRTLAPLTTDLVTTVTSAPEDGQNLTGAVPIDNFLANFTLSPGVTATWSVTETNSDGRPVDSQYGDLSHGLNLIKTVLLLPDVIALESLPNQVIPTLVNVTVLLQFDLPQLRLTGANAVTVPLGPVTLLRLPLVLPQVAAVFGNALGDWTSEGGQRALLTTDSVGAKLMPSLDAVIRLLSTLSSVLDTFAKATTLGVAADPSGNWANLLGLGQGVRLLVALLGRIPQSKIYFQQTYPGDEGGDRVILDSETLGNDDWNDTISAAIHIGVPYRDSGKWFRLSDANGKDWLDFNNPNAPFSFVSIVGNLNLNYDQSKHCFPPDTAQARDSSKGANMNDKLERLEFLIQF